MSMSVAEAQTEIKNRLSQADLLEKKYPDPETMPNEERDQVKRLLEEVDQLEDKLAGLEDAEQRRARIMKSLERHSKPAQSAFRPGYGDDVPEGKRISPGRQFLNSMDYRNIKQSGQLNSNMSRVEISAVLAEGTSLIDWASMGQKTLLRGGSNTSGQAFVLEDHQPGYLDILQAPLNIIDVIPRSSTESDTIEYVQESTFTNNAAFTAEATGFTASTLGGTGVKPESALAYSTQTATVRTMAHWIPVTNRMLADAPAIRGIIDGRLLFGLQQKLQSQVVSGDGTGENITGILNTAGVGVVSLGTDSRIDALYKGRTQVMWTGYGRPSAYMLNPTDWQSIRLSRESAATATPGTYLFGPPSGTGFPTLWGIPVIEDPNITQGTGLVGDFNQGATLFDREQGAVRVGTVNDQFIRNMQTILAELRVAFVVWRPAVFTKVTGL
jgi:HK97 family phage major capsid protein